ncbi:hypothetical protein EIO_0918 [Ketogulonicigenium vulgare Y25]|uniref:hypothetical protein n=1 Tax=Ketogulonicigenium vulgare TaxID=92945 RepID=UPI0001E67990|nr:hypothetical protein [Ketogulonicigenium vulgare]ADO42066.1 hypothetical protein EIO_0918 [Ketogulonicigenium vulgare Y25]
MTKPASSPGIFEIGIALATGGLMTIMLLSNSLMAAHTTPLFSSLTAHGVGAVALVLAGLGRCWRCGWRCRARHSRR